MTWEETCDGEDPDLPEKFSKSDLIRWAHAKNKKASPATSQRDILSDAHGILRSSEQHQQGLSVFMKRCRRDIIAKPPKPELIQAINVNIPRYLQEVQNFNPELMISTRTVEHCALPTRSTIEDEKRTMEAETRKPWGQGLVLRNSANLVDHNWKREQEDVFISKAKQESKARSNLVFMGVLQQWQESKDRRNVSSGSIDKPFRETNDHMMYEVQTPRECEVEKLQTLETVPEDEELKGLHGILAQSPQ